MIDSLSPSELSAKYRIPKRTVQAACKTGALKATKTGGVWLIGADEAQAFAENWHPHVAAALRNGNGSSGGPAVLYRVYDTVDRLLYVGVGHDIFLRPDTYAQKSPWEAYVTKVTYERYSDYKTASAAEAAAVRDEDPVWNMEGRPLDRHIRWMIAYPEREADDVTEQEVREFIREIEYPVACRIDKIRAEARRSITTV